jgi:hypothetical protein
MEWSGLVQASNGVHYGPRGFVSIGLHKRKLEAKNRTEDRVGAATQVFTAGNASTQSDNQSISHLSELTDGVSERFVRPRRVSGAEIFKHGQRHSAALLNH